MSETRAIRLLLVAFALATGVLAYSGAPLVNDTAPLGIVSFQLAGTGASAAAMLSTWDSAGHAAAFLNLVVDYPYLVIYGTLLVLLCRRAARTMSVAAVSGRFCVHAAWAAAAFDAIENAALLAQLNGTANDRAAAIAFTCASVKFVLLAIVITYLVVAAGTAGYRKFR